MPTETYYRMCDDQQLLDAARYGRPFPELLAVLAERLEAAHSELERKDLQVDTYEDEIDELQYRLKVRDETIQSLEALVAKLKTLNPGEKTQ